MSIFKCKMCGGTIEFEPGASVGVCDSCGTKQTLPRLDDDRRANLYDRANHFRRNNEFDKAMGIYEQILNEDNTDAEAYWSLVLCQYGIEYVEDPATHKRVPTVNRAQFTSIFDDDNYKSALQYADGYQRELYEKEAKEINEIQKGILAISQKEEPFDVFICYKETDQNGRRTPDSVLATDLYHQLTQEGFKVFFSRITLEDKLGTAYEPYIFAALNSAKVMVVLGTKPEYFNAVWVKNEWSRYLALVKKSGGKKILIPAYKDMDPYDLPEEFSHLQAQDMSKLGFMQDLIRGIKKIAKTDGPKATVREAVVVNTAANANIAPLLKRAFMFLEDGEWSKADDFCEQVLNQDPENAQAYLGKLMAELRVRRREDLQNCELPFDRSNHYQKAVRFGDEKLKSELCGSIDHINERNETARLTGIYNRASEAMNAANSEAEYIAAAETFQTIPGFKDADALAEQCVEKAETCRKDAEEESRIAAEKAAKKRKKIIAIAAPIVVACIVFLIVLIKVIIPNSKYNAAVQLREDGRYEEAIVAFEALDGFGDSKEQIQKCRYSIAEGLLDSGDAARAAILFENLGGYSDAKARCAALWEELTERQAISAGWGHTVGLKSDGAVVAAGDNYSGQCDVSGWTDIVAISAGKYHTVGLKADGTAVATEYTGDQEYYYGQCDVSGWTDIVAISAGDFHTVGLKADGTAVAVGYNDFGQCDVSGWTDIVAISAGVIHTVGLKADGTVVAVGYNDFGQCDVSGWTDIVAISAGAFHTVGLKADGTAVAVGSDYAGRCDVSGWTDIVAISAGVYHTVGLKADGTAVAVGWNYEGACDVSGWTDIVAISAGDDHTVGLKSDGTVVATEYTGNYYDGQCDVSGWTDIKLPKYEGLHE